MHKRINGFTLVELLVVIVVIGILTTIGIVSYSKVQANSRDSQRSAKIQVIAEALEKYYDQNGEYPPCSAVTAAPSTVSKTTLVGMDPNALTAPKAANGSNSLGCTNLVAGSNIDTFGYIGTGCDAQSCLSYHLQYYEESTGKIISLASRHTVQISTSGVPTLDATSVDTTTIRLTWSLVSNASSYIVQYSTTADFSSNITTLSDSPITGGSVVVSSLSSNTIYYFRVAALVADSQGDWSNIASATTYRILTAPTGVVATANSSSQITISWATVPDATSYNVESSTSSSFTNSTIKSGVTTLSSAITGLTEGQRYYFRVYAVSAVAVSASSSIVNAITIINAPATPSVTQSTSGDTTTYQWNSVTCSASGATSQYQYTYSTDWAYSSGWIGPVTSTSYAISSSYQGYQYTLTVQSRCYSSATGTSSTWSGSGQISYIRPVDAPGPITYGIYRGGANIAYVWAASSCGSSASLYTTGDIASWDAGWAGTTAKGWYADSHGGTWWLGWNYYGTTVTSGTQGTSNQPSYPAGWRWSIAVNMECVNSATGRQSGQTGRHESPVMGLPA